MTVQKEWALASMVFLLLTIVFSTVIYWYLYPVAEIVLIPPFRLSAYWCFPQALQFPIRRLTRWDLVCAFGTKAHIEVFFPKRIQKVPPPLAERLGRSTFTRHFLCSSASSWSRSALCLFPCFISAILCLQCKTPSCAGICCLWQLTCLIKVASVCWTKRGVRWCRKERGLVLISRFSVIF